MKVSTRSRYGLRAMLELAIEHGNGPVMMRTIATRQQISLKYLHALLTTLKTAGLVASARGASGGYTLARPPAQIRTSEVVRALEGPLWLVDCVNDAGSCDRTGSCVTREVWQTMADAIERALSGITLGDLVERTNSLPLIPVQQVRSDHDTHCQ